MRDKYTNIIKHYTNVDALYKILASGLRFGSSRKWSDKDDAFDIQVYKRIIKRNIAVLCFCNGRGTIHHWALARHQRSTCKEQKIRCNITLYKEAFIKYVSSLKKFEKPKLIKYCHEVETLTHEIVDIPYLKKSEYCVERELRFLYIGVKPIENAIIPNIIPFIKCIIINVDDCTTETYMEIRQKIETRYPQLRGKIARNDSNWQEDIEILVRKKISKHEQK